MEEIERQFYITSIMQLMSYNMLLLQKLMPQSPLPGAFPMPTQAYTSVFGIPMPDADDMKKLESAWKEGPFGPDLFKNMTDAFFKQPKKDDRDRDKLTK